MSDAAKPRDAKDVEDAVAWALGNGKSLDIAGRGSKRGIGRPAQTDLTLDLSGLTGVTLYEPEELVLSARAGTPLAEIEALVDSRSQQLAFEPMDYGPIFGAALGGGSVGGGSIGGTIAANLSGPRRIKAGAARDHFLGFSGVSGRGETFKSGGRVVKNVTGYDLCKLMAGSWGTLAALTDITIKVLPKPETEATLLVLGLGAPQAMHAMAAAMGSSCEVSGAAHLPAAAATATLLPDHPGSGASVTALRMEGVAPSVIHRLRALESLMAPRGELATLDDAASRALWQAIRDVVAFRQQPGAGERPLWRVSTAPMQGATFAGLLPDELGAAVLYHWAGGLVWVDVNPSNDAGAAHIRNALVSCGGHATLIRAPAATRAAVAVFAPQAPGVAALARRVKEGFDPKGVLNPGRMYAGV